MSTTVATGRFDRFCIVGVGGHARNRLLPAIRANGQQIAGLVTSQAAAKFPGTAVYARLEHALERLEPDVAVVISTPPGLHFLQATMAVEAGFDTIIEKPAFLTAGDAEAVRNAADRTGALVVEGFMHRHTALHARFLDDWRRLRDSVSRVGVHFLIPTMPGGTFRDHATLDASAVYDMGCYPLSLLADMGLDPAGLSLVDVRAPGATATEAIVIAGRLDGIAVDIQIGVGDPYENAVVLETAGGESIRFEPYFYGRPGERRRVVQRDGASAVETISVPDAFQAMFSVPRTAWRADQPLRGDRMIAAAAVLQGLAAQLGARRAEL